MRFGSVEFFKVLIKVVLAIFFFVPLAAAIIFAVLFFNKSSETDELKAENERLTQVTEVLMGNKVATAEDFAAVFDNTGLSYTDLIKAINAKGKVSPEGFYNILVQAGLSDKQIVELIASKNTVGAWEFYDVMTKNGITDDDLISIIAARNGATAENFYKILSAAGMSDSEIIEYINKKNGNVTPPASTSSTEQSSSSQTSSSQTSSSSGGQQNPPPAADYRQLYPDMYVTAPTKYVREPDTVYLTFDDGPSSNTSNILHYLNKYSIKATFFVVPEKTDVCYARMKAIVDGGNAIGVHSASHVYDDIYSSVEAFLKDFHDAREMIYEATGVYTEIFRFPGGSVNDHNQKTRDAIIEEMTRRGFRFYDWSVDSGDAAGATWTQMYNSVPKDVKANAAQKKRSFILMHDAKNRDNTCLVLEDIIGALLKEGLKFDKINNDTQPVQFAGPFA